MPGLPTSTVTLLFADIEGSTLLLRRLGDRYAVLLADYRRLLREAFQTQGGEERSTEGDGLYYVFSSARSAVLAAVAAQRAVRNHAWPEGVYVRVRIGMHTGEPAGSETGLVGIDVHRAARIMAATHGGQILVSHTTHALVHDDVPDSIGFLDLGAHSLKDFEHPRHLFQVAGAGLQTDFPDPRTEARTPRTRRRASIGSVAVLPLVNIGGDPDTDYLSDGITESIINSISQLPHLRVVARSTVFRYKGRDVDSRVAGGELKVDGVLTGRIQQRGDTLIVGMELVDVAEGWQFWGESYRYTLSQLHLVQEAVTKDVLTSLRIRLSQDQKRRMKQSSRTNAAAYQAYLKGMYHYNKFTEEGVKRSVEYLGQATKLDPNFALSYAGLADAYHQQFFDPPRERMPKARAAAEKALQLDEALAEAHAPLGWVSWRFDWNWEKAEQEFRRAIQLNPNYARAHAMYAYFLSSMGRYDEALQEQFQAEELNPLSPVAAAGHGLILYFRRRYDEAIEQYQKTLELDPHFAMAHARLGSTYLQKGRIDEAIASYLKAEELDPSGDRSGLATAHAVSGDSEKALKILEELELLSERRYVSSVYVAIVHTALNRADRAFEWLYRGYSERDGNMVFLKVAPDFDSLRAAPEFTDILEKVGLRP